MELDHHLAPPQRTSKRRPPFIPFLILFLAQPVFAASDLPPIVTAPAEVIGAEGSPVSFSVGVIEPDGDDVIGLTAGTVPAGAVFTAAAGNLEGSFVWTPGFDQAGTYSVTIAAKSVSRAVPVSAQVPLDGTATIEIQVENVDRPPALDAPAIVTGREGHLISFRVETLDPDGDPILSLAAAPLPAGSTFQVESDNTIGTFNWTPAPGQAGTHAVMISAQSAPRPYPVSGPIPIEASTLVSIVVGPANSPPVITPIPDITLSAGELRFASIQATDPDGPTAFIFSLVTAPAFVTRTGASLRIAPAVADTGTVDVTYSVSDGQATAVDEFRITVTGMPPCGGIPVISAPPYRVLVDASRDGGVWWAPQGSAGNPTLPHSGKKLADDLRARGVEVVELPPRSEITKPSVITPELLAGYDLVIRANGREYSASELGAYSCYVAGGGRLLLLSEFRRQGQSDELAKLFGLDLHGLSYGENRVTQFVPHPITTGVQFISYQGGSGLFAASPTVTVLGYLSPATFVDPEGDLIPTPQPDPAGMPAMGVASYGDGKYFFIGDTNGMLGVPQPLWDNLLGYMLDQHPPLLTPAEDMTVRAEEIAEQELHATDPDGGVDLSFGRVDGPAYLTVLDTGPSTGIIRAAPTTLDIGVRTAIVRVSDEILTVRDTLDVTVTPCSVLPVVTQTAFETLQYSQPGIILADLNRDAKADIVALNGGSQAVSVFLGLGGGSYGNRLDTFTAGQIGYDAAAADIDEDGNIDLVVPHSLEGGWVLFGNGDGTFRDTAARFYDGYGLAHVAVRDFNADGHEDIAATNFNLHAVQVFLGRGDGSFDPAASYPVVNSPISIAPGDLDRDGSLDLVVGRESNPASPGGDPISVLFGNPDGTFGRRIDPVAGLRPRDVVLGDVNEDGNLDIVTANYQGGTPRISVMLGDGDGALASRQDYAPGYAVAGDPVLADFDHDGHVDLIGAASMAGFGLTVILGTGDGSFRCPSSLPVGFAATDVAAGNLDSDCRIDFVVAEGGLAQNHIFALTNKGIPGAPGCAPVVTAPPDVDGVEGQGIAFGVSAMDPDGESLESLSADLSTLPLGHGAVFSVDLVAGTGSFVWTPSFQDGRAVPYVVRFECTAGGQLGAAGTRVRVANVNRVPVANAGGPYVSVVGGSVEFRGSDSSDPDGDALQYAWSLGDGTNAVGVYVLHHYVEAGEFEVVLEVTDGVGSDRDSTNCSVADALPARAFLADGHRTMPLGAGSQTQCIQLEPVGGAYENAQLDLSRLTLVSTGTGTVDRIASISDKTVSTEDRDRNGTLEVPACFRRQDLQLLLGAIQGRTDVAVQLEGFLVGGERVSAPLTLTVVGLGGNGDALLTPNPVRDVATLVFRTAKEGTVSVRLYDARGRLVRSLYDASRAPVGYHEISIDLRDLAGGKLSSGTYFYRIDCADSKRVGRLVVIR